MTTRTQRITGTLVLALAGTFWIAVSGCRTAGVPADPTGALHHHNWWNYYRRGIALLRQGDVESAKQDFERSLGLRDGATYGFDRDMWRARTYGLHFIEGYFPNRELGVCFFKLNDPLRAIRFLETSLDQEPSGRAKYYLNLARSQELGGRDLAPPSIDLGPVGPPAYTMHRSRVLRGKAGGPGLVRQIWINGEPEFIELAEQEIAFEQTLQLTEGTNVVTVAAQDLLGQRSAVELRWVADWSPPGLLVRSVSRQAAGWLLEGVCRDSTGISGISLNGTALRGGAGPLPAREVPLSFAVSSGKPALFRAVDLAGNTLEVMLDADRLTGADATSAQPVMLASAALPDGVLDTGAPVLALAGDAPGDVTDRLPPSLRLGGVKAVTRVFDDEFFLDGSAGDGGGLASVSVSGENLLAAQDRGAVRAYFSRRIPLAPGTNRFEIVAADTAGNTTPRTLTVIRGLPEFLDDAYRLSVGVPPLIAEPAAGVGARAKHSMEEELLREPVRFRLLERDEGWDFVLREQGLSVSDLGDPRAALRIGRMLPAEMLFMGKIILEEPGMTIYVKAVETGRGEVVYVSDVYCAEPDRDLDYQVSGLVMKIEQGFPLIKGEVLRSGGSKATLNVGYEQGAAVGSRFIVVRPDPETQSMAAGEVCKVEGRPVEMSLERVRKDSGIARVFPSSAAASIKEGYYVYAR